MKANKFMPTFSQADLERINRSGLSKKESILWVVWHYLHFCFLFFAGIAIATFVSFGATYLSARHELPLLVEQVKFVVLFAISLAVGPGSLFMIPHGLMRVEAINSRDCGVISFSVFLASYTEDRSRWDILSNYSVALVGHDPRFGTAHNFILFFPPWERTRIAMKINKLMKKQRMNRHS